MTHNNFSSEEKSDAGDYWYGFNGMEKDDEVKGHSGTSYTTHFRQYDPRVGRWLSIDPKFESFPGYSPYAAMNLNPIWFNDFNGDSSVIYAQIKMSLTAGFAQARDMGFIGFKVDAGSITLIELSATIIKDQETGELTVVNDEYVIFFNDNKEIRLKSGGRAELIVGGKVDKATNFSYDKEKFGEVTKSVLGIKGDLLFFEFGKEYDLKKDQDLSMIAFKEDFSVGSGVLLNASITVFGAKTDKNGGVGSGERARKKQEMYKNRDWSHWSNSNSGTKKKGRTYNPPVSKEKSNSKKNKNSTITIGVTR